jgi:hypothetical protein
MRLRLNVFQQLNLVYKYNLSLIAPQNRRSMERRVLNMDLKFRLVLENNLALIAAVDQ